MPVQYRHFIRAEKGMFNDIALFVIGLFNDGDAVAVGGQFILDPKTSELCLVAFDIEFKGMSGTAQAV